MIIREYYRFLQIRMEYISIIEFCIVIIVGCLLSAMILPKISLVAFKKRLFDEVDERKMHTIPIPRLGGLAFFPCITVAVSLSIICHNLWVGNNLLDIYQTTRLLTMVSCLFMLYLMGIMDDLIGVLYRSKFVIQIFCGVLLVASGFYFDSLHGLFGIQEIHPVIGMPFTVLIIVYILNAFNLIDGIDGLASGLSMIAFFAFGCMFASLRWWMYTYIAFGAFSVLIPFFYYNVFGSIGRGRKIFMGDTGSLTVGFLLAVLAIRLSMADPEKERIIPGAIVIAFSFLIVPMLDVVRVVIHRLRSGKNPFLPDRNHIHHKFIALGMSQRKAMISIVILAALFALGNYFLIHSLSVTSLFLLDVAVWTVMHCYITVKINRKHKAEKLTVQKK